MFLTMCIAGASASACTAVRWYLDRTSRRDSSHLGGRVHLTALRNHGSAFGLLRLNSRRLAALSAALMAGALPLRKSSRVGCGLLLGGKLHGGPASSEAGHLVICHGGELCNCGRRGCWERYASASALKNLIMLPFQTALLVILFSALMPVLRRSKLVPEQISGRMPW